MNKIHPYTLNLRWTVSLGGGTFGYHFYYRNFEVHVDGKPVIKIDNCNQKVLAVELHKKAGKCCFIANSCNFPIYYEPNIECSSGS